MADTLSSNFCCLCGFSFDRFASEKENKRTSLSSPIVENSGLLDRLNIKISSLTKELLFICFSCCTVFTNYTEAKANFHNREREILKLLTEPVTEKSEKEGQLPFIPYLKRRCMTKAPSSLLPVKIPKIETTDTTTADKESGGTREVEDGVKVEKCGGNGSVALQGNAKEPNTMTNNNKNVLENNQDLKRKFLEVFEKSYQGSSSSSSSSSSSLLSELWESSKEFKDGCLSFLSLLILKETSDILRRDTLFNKTMSVQAIHDLSWTHTMEVLSNAAPATLCLILALLGVDANTGSKESIEAQHTLVGHILSMVLYKRFKRRANFIPSLHGLQIQSMRVPARMRRKLHEIGFTIPSVKIPSILKTLNASEHDLIHSWKRDLERTLQVIPRRPTADEPPRKLPADRRKPKSILPKPVAVTTYGLTWGGVESRTSTTTTTTTTGSCPPPSLSQAYIVRHRVPFMMTYRNDVVRRADNIPFEEFVPDSEDFIRVRNHMRREVQRILTQHVPLFRGMEVDDGHQYSEYAGRRTQMSDLGAVFKSTSDSGSVASLLKNLKKYMVASNESEVLSLCIFGGKDSVDRMVRAKDIMSCFSDKVDRLDGIEPCIADHGRQIVLAKDIISIFFPRGVTDKTSILRHLNMDEQLLQGADTSDFPSLQALIQLLAHTYTLALGEKKYGLMMDEDKLTDEEKQNILEQLSDDIVCDIWPVIHTDSLDTVRQGNKAVKDRGN